MKARGKVLTVQAPLPKQMYRNSICKSERTWNRYLEFSEAEQKASIPEISIDVGSFSFRLAAQEKLGKASLGLNSTMSDLGLDSTLSDIGLDRD